jgi:Predicted Zn-dependent protease (DUF2268)
VTRFARSELLRARELTFAALLVGAGLASAAPPATAIATAEGAHGKPIIRVEDVERFYAIYDAADGHPGAQQLQQDYLDAGSDGLHNFARLRNITGDRIETTLNEDPSIYIDARRCAAVLPRVHDRLRVSMRRLAAIYPDARFPPVTVAVGRGQPVGVGDSINGVMIGLEALCGVQYFDANVEDRFVHVIAHEYVHVQQTGSVADAAHPTVLEESLIEGAAEFVGELISGGVSSPAIRVELKGHEAEIETAFVADEDKTDLSHWLYNGSLTKPGDLGYWVGYRIVKSYYQHARDKHQALRDILQMTDARSFVDRSGWQPGKVAF